ncbi:MAG: PIN domain-containing protein [Nanoarchaeota archaeon]
MKIVVDANILFSLSKESSSASSISQRFNLKLFAPKFALLELTKYKEELIKKSKRDFESIISDLKQRVSFIDESEYSKFLSEPRIKVSDPKDITYLALALKINSPIWSNDPHLKQQSSITVFTTEELIEILGE